MTIPSNDRSKPNRAIRSLIWICICLFGAQLAFSQTNLDPQCTLTDLNGGVISILDQDTFGLRFRIRGSTNPIVNQNFQGICGVRLKFRHQNLSDLEIRLTSPNGTTVTLIGPAVVGGTRPQFFEIGHDVIFRPFPNPVTPHPDLATPDFKWSNNNLNWGSQTSYDGSYYPFEGDFSDFTGDDINGIWELTVSDGFQNERGVLEEFEIEFCDDSNLTCDPCEAIAGSFEQDTIVICEGQDFDISSLQTLSDSDPGLYTTEIFVYDEDDRFVLGEEQPSLAGLDSGTYTLHSFTILQSNYDTTESDLQFMTRPFLVDSVRTAGGFLCMDISDAVVLSVERPNIVPVRRILCPGDTIDFRGTIVTEAGIYRDTIDGCSDILELTVDASDLDARFGEDTIFTDCITGIVTYGANITNATGPLSYQWSEVNGPLLGTDSTFTFTQGGDYELYISDDLCDTTINLTVEIPGVGFTLAVTADPPQFDCSFDSTTIALSYNFSADSILWFLDDQAFERDIDEVRVGVIGRYRAEVYGGIGCILMDSVDITVDTIIPDATITAPVITCSDPIITARFSSPNNISAATWIRGMDTISLGLQVPIDQAGNYELFLVGTNGCDTLIPFEVMEDVQNLDISGIPTVTQILNCENPLLSISPVRNSGDLREEYWVIGGTDTLPGVNDIVIRGADNYEYVAIGTNGCISSQSFDVEVDTISPQFSFMTSDISCQDQEGGVILTGIMDSWEVAFTAGGVISETDTSVSVSQSGSIDFIVRDTTNGCSTQGNAEILSDQEIPPIVLSGDNSLNCQRPDASLFADISGADLSDFYWISPGSDTNRMTDLVVVDAGDYIFEALGTNGCSFRHVVNLTDDRDLPDIPLPDQVEVNCAQTNIQLTISDPSELNSVTWINGADTVISTSYNAPVQSDQIEVIFEGLNGCLASDLIAVVYDTVIPVFNLIGDTIDCDNPSIQITADVNLDNHTFTWAGTGVAGNTESEVTVSSPGGYALNVVDTTNGCAYLEVIDIVEDIQLPTFSVLPVDTITCEQPGVDVSLQTEMPNDVLWQTSDGRIEQGASVFASQSGQQLFNITGPNGCAISDSVEVYDNLVAPGVDLEDTYIISCANDEFTLTPQFLDPIQAFTWRFTDGRTSNATSETITDDDLESLSVIGENGCETIIQFDISFATDRPNAVIDNTELLICDESMTNLVTAPPVSADHQIFWYEGDQVITSDQTVVSVAQSGQYILEVIDTVSSCFSRDTIDLVITSNPLTSVDLEAFDETCAGDNNGFIRVNSINGGSGNVALSVDGMAIDIMNPIELDPGDYLIEAMDELGCILESMASIRPGGSITVELGPDINAERGQQGHHNP